MCDDDLEAFTETLDAACSLLSRGQYRPNEAAAGMFFGALRNYPLEAVQAAFAAHVNTSKFPPVPADLIAHLDAMDGRLGPEEAFALALTATDERETVVWTEEIAKAWEVARHVMPNETSARMAFKEAYTRELAAVRAARKPLQWVLCQGHDAARRADAIKTAAAQGRIPHNADDVLALPAPREAIALPAPADTGRVAGIEALLRVRERLTAPKPYEPGPDVRAREATATMQHAAADEVAEYAARQGLTLPKPGDALRRGDAA